MKFKGRLVDSVCISHFSDVVATLAKTVKTCVIRLDWEKITFLLSEQGSKSMNVWCQMKQGKFFEEYTIEGVGDSGAILLEVNTDLLVRALKSGHCAQCVSIKLTKKSGAYLSIQISQPTVVGGARVITQDVPINLVPLSDWDNYQEPDMPDYSVSMVLDPFTSHIRGIIDRMKGLGNHIVVAGNNSGLFCLKLETDIVTVTTHYNNFKNHIVVEDVDRDHMFDVRVDAKKLSHLFSGNFNPTKVICNIVDSVGLQLFMLHHDVSLQYYIPCISR